MDNFNLKKFLTENKLTKTSVLREGLGAYEFEKFKKEADDLGINDAQLRKYIERFNQIKNSPKIANKDLKNYTLSQLMKIVTEGVSSDEEEKTMSKKAFKQKIKEMIIAELSLAEGEEEIVDDTDAYNFLKEAKKKKKEEEAPEEELDLNFDQDTPEGEEDTNIDFNQEEPAAEDNFNIDTSAVDPNIKAVQDALTQAQAAAEKIQDEKLTQQIGNTITMFTRTHIANKEPIR